MKKKQHRRTNLQTFGHVLIVMQNTKKMMNKFKTKFPTLWKRGSRKLEPEFLSWFCAPDIETSCVDVGFLRGKVEEIVDSFRESGYYDAETYIDFKDEILMLIEKYETNEK